MKPAPMEVFAAKIIVMQFLASLTPAEIAILRLNRKNKVPYCLPSECKTSKAMCLNYQFQHIGLAEERPAVEAERLSEICRKAGIPLMVQLQSVELLTVHGEIESLVDQFLDTHAQFQGKIRQLRGEAIKNREHIQVQDMIEGVLELIGG